MTDQPIPFQRPLAGKTPRLISTSGDYLGTPSAAPMPLSDPPRPAGVVIQGPGPAPLVTAEAEKVQWSSALDALKALVHDIEAGRVTPPSAIYIAMMCPKALQPEMITYPSYVWTGEMKYSRLIVAGLLEHHKSAIV